MRGLTVLLASGAVALALGWAGASADAPPPAPKKKSARPSPSPSASPSPSPKPAPRVFTDDDLPSSAAAGEKARERAQDKAAGKDTGPEKPAVDPALAQAEAARRAEEDRAVEAEREARNQKEADWRQKAKDARGRVKSGEEMVTNLEARSTAISGEILLSTDTHKILDLKAEQRKVEADLEAARAEVVAARKGIEDLEEQGRRQGIPRNWLE